MKRIVCIFGFMFFLTLVLSSCYTQSMDRSSNYLHKNSEDEYTSIFLEERRAQEEYYRQMGYRHFPNNPYALNQMVIVNGGFPVEGYHTMAVYFWWPRLMPRFGWQAYNYSVFDYEWYENPDGLYGWAKYYLLYKPNYRFGTATEYRKNEPVTWK